MDPLILTSIILPIYLVGVLVTATFVTFYQTGDEFEAVYLGTFAGLFWPLTLPFVGFMLLVSWLARKVSNSV